MSDASFGADQQAKLDFAYGFIGKVSSAAKALVLDVAARAPHHTYFAGCSNGGREAMMAAGRFPTEFDGVLACNPAFRVSKAGVLSIYSGEVYAQAATEAGVNPAHFITPADAAVFQRALLATCDGLDGAKDGMIFDHAACRFDIRTLGCRKDQTQDCLAPAKIAAIARAFAGPHDEKGRQLVGGWTFDTGDFTPGWLMWQTGMPTPDGKAMMQTRMLVEQAMARYFSFPPMTTPLAGGDAAAQALLERTAATGALTDSDSTDFRTFAARGGRMILVTGWSDPIFSASDLIDWYGRLSADTEAATGKKADGFARLFLVPGMLHCGGGPGLDDFDALGALVDWVERQSAPDEIVARGQAFPGVSRPLCAYPKIARYGGSGPTEAAESFVCR
jgi:feruloyl esterase